jgi:hypothetical protein
MESPIVLYLAALAKFSEFETLADFGIQTSLQKQVPLSTTKQTSRNPRNCKNPKKSRNSRNSWNPSKSRNSRNRKNLRYFLNFSNRSAVAVETKRLSSSSRTPQSVHVSDVIHFEVGHVGNAMRYYECIANSLLGRFNFHMSEESLSTSIHKIHASKTFLASPHLLMKCFLDLQFIKSQAFRLKWSLGVCIHPHPSPLNFQRHRLLSFLDNLFSDF